MTKKPITHHLLRDGEIVFSGTWIELLEYIHANHSFSFSWACEHEGYSVEEADAISNR
jgi:hypothetical protein